MQIAQSLIALLFAALPTASLALSEGPCEAMPFAIEGRLLDVNGGSQMALPHGEWPIRRFKRDAYANPESSDSDFRLEFDASIGGAGCDYPDAVTVVALGKPGQYRSARVPIRDGEGHVDLVLPPEPEPAQWQELEVEFKAETSACGGGLLMPDSMSEFELTRIVRSDHMAGVTLFVWTDYKDTCRIPPDSARARRIGSSVWLSYELVCRTPEKGEPVSYCMDTPRLRFHLPDLDTPPEAVWLLDQPRPVQAPFRQAR